MNLHSMVCAGTSTTVWFAAGIAFLALGVRQPAFIGIGAACVALGLRQHRGGACP